jgi:hypothetical protein
VQNKGDQSLELWASTSVFVSASTGGITNSYLVHAGETVTFLVGGGQYTVVSHHRVTTPDYDVWTYTGGTFSNLNASTIGGTTINLATYNTPDEKELLYYGKSLEQVILINNSTSTSNVTLYAATAVRQGTRLIIKNVGTYDVTVNRGSTDTIDGETSISLPLQYSSVTLVSNGNNAWYII